MAIFLKFEIDENIYLVELKSELRIGRGRHNDFVIHDRNVSQNHCIIGLEIDGVYLKDLGSKNGTFVNNTVVGHHRIGYDDKISIGEKTKISFQLEKLSKADMLRIGPSSLHPQGLKGLTLPKIAK